MFHAQVGHKYFPKAPQKGTDEVMVSVRAASINPADYKVCFLCCLYNSKAFACIIISNDNIAPYPHKYQSETWPVVGSDVAGVVIEVAENSTSPFKVGDEVFGVTKGSLADRVSCSSATLARKPDRATFAQAAAMPTSYLTSLQALRGLIVKIFTPQCCFY